MANDKSKIERLGLTDRVNELLKSGVTVGKRIGKILREEGHVISDAAVNRYLAPLRDTMTDAAAKIMSEHVDKVLPEDLKALESMEAQCLGWAGESIKDQMERIAEASTGIMSEVEAWIEMFKGLDRQDEKSVKIFVKSAVQVCLDYITKEARLQTKKIQAMQMATKIIELKLKNAGLLEDDDTGRILVVDRRNSPNNPDAPKEPEDGYKLFAVPGGKS